MWSLSCCEVNKIWILFRFYLYLSELWTDQSVPSILRCCYISSLHVVRTSGGQLQQQVTLSASWVLCIVPESAPYWPHQATQTPPDAPFTPETHGWATARDTHYTVSTHAGECTCVPHAELLPGFTRGRRECGGRKAELDLRVGGSRAAAQTTQQTSQLTSVCQGKSVQPVGTSTGASVTTRVGKWRDWADPQHCHWQAQYIAE